MDAGQRIAINVNNLRSELAELFAKAARDDLSSLNVIAVTKTQDPLVLEHLSRAGIQDFGENRLDHLQQMLASNDASYRFHGIGRIQSRQIPQWVEHCNSLHSLHDPGHLNRLVRACETHMKSISVFIQVNTSGEEQKAGIHPDALSPFVDQCRQHDCIKLGGLMCMAPKRQEDGSNDGEIRRSFESLRLLAEAHNLTKLSMGMSGDYDLAIAEGATDIRIGTKLFQ